jgi:predicted amidohydrolase
MTFRIGAVQMNSQGNKEANLATAGRLIDEAAAQGADVVALPEMFNIYGTSDEIRAGREPMGGPTSQFLQGKAKQHGITLHGGSIPVQVPDSDKAWNISLVYDSAGELVATYRKIHLFDIDITGTVSDNESSRYDAGTEMVAFESEHGQFGLTICYDIRFPEVYRALTLAGSRVIFQPSAFTLYTGKDHWEALIRARAIENQVYMVSPAQIGTHAGNKTCYGNTMIVDPWGTVLARAPERECVVVADIDYAAQDKIRAGLPNLKHRRPDVYAGDVSRYPLGKTL